MHGLVVVAGSNLITYESFEKDIWIFLKQLTNQMKRKLKIIMFFLSLFQE